MINFNEEIEKTLYNEYGGSEKKLTVLLKDGKQYLLKLPDVTREKDRELSYINNAISEYLGCSILQSIGFETQDVLLGEYTTEKGKKKIACACADVRRPGEKMYELEKIVIGSDDDGIGGSSITFHQQEVLLKSIKDIPEKEFLNFYYDLFVADAFIGNPDRHNNNVAFLSDGISTRISPVYDCGSSLCPLISEEELTKKTILMESMNVCSVIKGEDGSRLNYATFLKGTESEAVVSAMKRIIPQISLDRIYGIIEGILYISQERKDFYKEMLTARYEHILIPALAQACKREYAATVEKDENADYHALYRSFIKPLKNSVCYVNRTPFCISEGNSFFCSKAGKNHVFCYQENGEYLGLLPVRSSNDDIRTFVAYMKAFGYHVALPERCVDEENKTAPSASEEEKLFCGEDRGKDVPTIRTF